MENICISCARQDQDPQVQPTAGGQDQALQTPGRQGQGQITRGQPPSQQSPSAPVTKTAQPPTGRTQVYSVQQPTSPITQQVVQRPAQEGFSTSYQTPQSAHKIAPSVQKG